MSPLGVILHGVPRLHPDPVGHGTVLFHLATQTLFKVQPFDGAHFHQKSFRVV